MEKYLLLANQQWSKMILLHNEYCFQWDLECLVKSNQIKSKHTFQYHISHFTVNILAIILCLYFSEWRKIWTIIITTQLIFHFISMYFSWLMCCHNFHDHWSLFCDYLDYHLQEHNHRMKWYVVWEDLEWEMKWKWTIITYFQIQQHDNM